MRAERWLMMGLLCCMPAVRPGASAVSTAQTGPRFSPPAPPAAAIQRLIGQYGPPEAPLTIYEAAGRLVADGDGLRHALLRRAGGHRFVTESGESAPRAATLDFAGEGSRPAVAIALNGTRLPRRDFGDEVMRHIRAGVHADRSALRAQALRATPPREPAPVRPDDLVDLAAVDASMHFDIRYATTNNFMGFPLYDRPGAYLQRPAAEALGRVARNLAPRGYGLVIHDAYRPWFVTKMFWDATPDTAHVFVADPATGSRHNRGCAVDLTLYELATGKVVTMTGRYDEMSPRSFADYSGGTSRERWLRDLLRQSMEQQGFLVYPQEWWHFDYRDWHDYGIGNVPFERLEAAHSG